MHREDNAISVARWTTDAVVAAIATMRREVCAFAQRHGMEPDLRHDVGVAVSEAVAAALAEIVSREARSGRLTVSAATDGAWLSVRVACDADRPVDGGRAALPLVRALADRFEWGPAAGGSGASVLMEFHMRPAAATRPAPVCASAGRRKRPGRLVPGASRSHPAAPHGRVRRRR